MNIHSMSSHTCIYIHICVKGCREGRRVRERPKKDAMDTTARGFNFPYRGEASISTGPSIPWVLPLLRTLLFALHHGPNGLMVAFSAQCALVSLPSRHSYIHVSN